jgi:hypothetical protein
MFGCACSSIAGVDIDWRFPAVWFFLSATMLYVGRFFLTFADMPHRWRRSFPLEILVGGSLLSVTCSVLKIFLPVGMEVVAVLVLIGVFVAHGLMDSSWNVWPTTRHRGFWGFGGRIAPNEWRNGAGPRPTIVVESNKVSGLGDNPAMERPVRSRSRRLSSPSFKRQSCEIIAVVISFISATAWGRLQLPIVENESTGLYYRPFVEMFYHAMRGSALAYPGSPHQLGSFQFAGEPLPFYQYGSYFFPSLVYRWTGEPLWQSVSTVWYPQGLIWVGLAAYSLGTLFGGARNGVLATGAVAAIPDIYFFLPKIGIAMFSFHRFIDLSPALCYGCGAASAAFILFYHSLFREGHSTFLGSMVLLLSVGFLKFNVFIPLFILFAIMLGMAAFFRPASRTIIQLSPFVGIAFMGCLLMQRVPNAPTLGLSEDLGAGFFLNTLQSGGQILADQFPILLATNGAGLLARVLMILMLMFGVFLPIIPLVVTAWGRCRTRRQQLLLVSPFLVILICLALFTFLAPNENGDPYELAHRHFVWCYLFVVAAVVAIVARQWIPRGDVWTLVVWMVAQCAMPMIPITLSQKELESGRLEIPSGFIESCEFVRETSSTLDVVASADSDPFWMAAAITQRRMYVCTSIDETFPGHVALKETIRSRQAEIAELQKISSVEDLINWSRRTGVRWFIAPSQTLLAWPSVVADYPTYAEGDCRVYDFSLLTGISQAK